MTLGITTFGGNSREVTDTLRDGGIKFHGQNTR